MTKKNENINLLKKSGLSVTASRSFKKTQIKQGRKTVGGYLQMLNYGRKSKFKNLNKHDCEKSACNHKPMKNMPKSRRI